MSDRQSPKPHRPARRGSDDAYEDWCVGDVVLFRGDEDGKPGNAARAIIEGFQKGAGATHPEWVHVGLYDGNGCVYDAQPQKNVGRHYVADLIERPGFIHVRRLRNLVTSTQKVRAAIKEQGNAKYRMWAPEHIAGLAQRLARRSLSDERLESPDFVICSVFVDKVLSLAAGSQIFRKLPIVMPCDFADSVDFECVETKWCIAQKLGA